MTLADVQNYISDNAYDVFKQSMWDIEGLEWFSEKQTNRDNDHSYEQFVTVFGYQGNYFKVEWTYSWGKHEVEVDSMTPCKDPTAKKKEKIAKLQVKLEKILDSSLFGTTCASSLSIFAYNDAKGKLLAQIINEIKK